ncbi:1973_t:CDS:1, partial [Cetraspora pellucida]
KLLIEKNQEKNMIDELVHCQSQIGYMKKCLVCQTSNIDNRKRVCPTCNNKLLTISEINQQFIEPSNTNIVEKSLDIRSYTLEEAQLAPENEIYTPQLF